MNHMLQQMISWFPVKGSNELIMIWKICIFHFSWYSFSQLPWKSWYQRFQLPKLRNKSKIPSCTNALMQIRKSDSIFYMKIICRRISHLNTYYCLRYVYVRYVNSLFTDIQKYKNMFKISLLFKKFINFTGKQLKNSLD